MFLKAATAMSSDSQRPSPTSFVYVRSRIITGEHGVISDAAWAAPGILNICLKNKEEIYNPPSPFVRSDLWGSLHSSKGRDPSHAPPISILRYIFASPGIEGEASCCREDRDRVRRYPVSNIHEKSRELLQRQLLATPRPASESIHADP
ncbi:unnamed protein product [Sphagnum troendelagicum]